ncbi:MAG: ABC transporter permease [Bacillota bacterium]|nr:MAG: diguanylate cyclase [Bacillota bacterium]
MLAESWRRFRRSRSGVFGLAVVTALVLVALLAPWLTPCDPLQPDYAAVMQPPSRAHPLGTDNFGRDVLARTLYGARLSLRAGVTSVAVALALGLPIGLVSGYYRGFWDEYVIMRVVDALQAFPFLILALAVTAALGQGLNEAMIAIGIGFTPGFIRIVRSAVLEVRTREYVLAARSLGAGDGRILLRHVLPNALGPIIVQTTLSVAAAIIAEAGLSYLGLGAQPPEPSWGSDLRAAQGFLTLAPWMAIWPGLAIFLSVLGFNMLGDGLRDALDPRLRGD